MMFSSLFCRQYFLYNLWIVLLKEMLSSILQGRFFETRKGSSPYQERLSLMEEEPLLNSCSNVILKLLTLNYKEYVP